MAKRDSETDDLLHEGKKAFEQAESAEAENRRVALEDIKFAREGIQWPDHIRKQREEDSRPCLTINKLPAFIRQVVNDSRQNKPAIHVHPVDSGADKKTAEIMGGLIRNIEYTSNADIAYDTAVECAVTGGVGYLRVAMKYAYEDIFDPDLCIERVSNPFSIYGDPNSRAADSSDWDVAFATDRMTKAQYEKEYGDKPGVDWDDAAWSGDVDWVNDDGVLIAEWWTREKVKEPIFLFTDTRIGKPFVTRDLGDQDNKMLIEQGILQYQQQRESEVCKVKRRILSGSDILEEEDWPGIYIPIIPVYGEEFDIEGKRFFRSLIHNAKDAQMMFNVWRTTSTELVGLAPKAAFIGPKGAFDSDQARWSTANTKSHPYLEYDLEPVLKAGRGPERQPLDSGPAAGALQEAMSASDDIKAILGMFDASLGAKSNETSGRAILARQREGDVSSFHFIDNMSRAIRHTGRILIDLIPKVYTEARIVRIIGEDGTQVSQTVNQEAPEMDKKGNEVVDETGQAIMAMHDLTAGKYDLTVTTGPSFTTRREEAAAQMTELMRALPQSAPILGKHLAKNLDWPGADDIAEELEEMGNGEIPPELQKAIEEGKQQIQQLTEENQQLKMDQSAEQAKMAAQAQAEQAKMQSQQQLEAAKLASSVQTEQAKLEAHKQIEMMKIAADKELARIRISSEMEIAELKARLSAQASVEAADIKAKNTPPPAAN